VIFGPVTAHGLQQRKRMSSARSVRRRLRMQWVARWKRPIGGAICLKSAALLWKLGLPSPPEGMQ
jgi:hypothetical protein